MLCEGLVPCEGTSLGGWHIHDTRVLCDSNGGPCDVPDVLMILVRPAVGLVADSAGTAMFGLATNTKRKMKKNSPTCLSEAVISLPLFAIF